MPPPQTSKSGTVGFANGEDSLSSFFSFRLVSLVSSFAKEETREMRQRNPNANESSKKIWFSETPPFSFSFTMKRRSRIHSKTSGARSYIVVVNTQSRGEVSMTVRFTGL